MDGLGRLGLVSMLLRGDEGLRLVLVLVCVQSVVGADSVCPVLRSFRSLPCPLSSSSRVMCWLCSLPLPPSSLSVMSLSVSLWHSSVYCLSRCLSSVCGFLWLI